MKNLIKAVCLATIILFAACKGHNNTGTKEDTTHMDTKLGDSAAKVKDTIPGGNGIGSGGSVTPIKK